MNGKRFFSALLCAMMVMSLLPTPSLAADGDLTVTGGMVGTDYTYSNGVLAILTRNSLTISGTTTTDSIVVKSGITANITLSGVSIDCSTVDGACAFDIEAGSAANIWLEGDTTLKSGSIKAGLHVPSGAMLSIYGTGSLTAEGVLAEAGNKQGAGIGGNNAETCGFISINGGNITAKGGISAGIGGGNGGAGGTVFIKGGTTTALSADGAGIGGGAAGYGGSVAISGGTVRATSDSQGAGIGGGASGKGGSVTISGGTVRANGNLGAGIGGGFNGDGGTVYISGGSVLAATSAGYAIGCGRVLVRQLDPGTLQNNSIEKTPVFLTAVTLDGVSSETAVTKLNHSYGMNNVFTDVSGKLYLYLPQETSTTWAQAASGEYVGSVVTASNHMASGTLALLPKEPTPAATFTATGPDCGTLENVEIGMKYRAHDGPFWHDVTASTMDLTGITPANGIQVKRLGDHSTTVDSDVQTITVTKAAVPSAGKVKCMTAANNDGMLTGVTSAMEYKKSGAASFTGITGSNVTGLTPGIYYVRVKASGTTLASDDQTLVIAPYNPGTAHGGDFTVTGGIIGTDYAYTDGVLTVLTSTPLTISGTSIYECIVVNSGITANITLSGVSIDSFDINDACAFDIEAGATANITLERDTTLKSGPGKAGLHVPIGATLTMNGTGSLTADAASFGGYMQGAGIGGNHGEACGTITINGGSITANGSFSAGIGGGSGGAGGTVFVNGGTIVAGSSNGGAGIGGGSDSNGGSVTITGGTVHATSVFGGGIGGGAGVDGAGDITITGGMVIAASSAGAGIGSGGYSADGGSVTITGGTVIATGEYGAGIGGGVETNGKTVYISGGSVLATSSFGEAIGMGSGGSGSGTLQNNSTEKAPVYLTTVTLDGIASETAVTMLNHGYGMNDVFTDASGKLYLYLPQATGTTWAQAASGEYAGLPIITNVDHTASGTLTLIPKAALPPANTVNATPGANHTATASITYDVVSSALKKALGDAAAQGKAANVTIHVIVPQCTSKLSVTLSQDAMKSLINAGVGITINGNGLFPSITLDIKALKALQKQANGDATFTFAVPPKLSAYARKLIGDRPVYSMSASYVKRGKVRSISRLSGAGFVSIPYTFLPGEAAEHLFGVAIDSKGNTTRVRGSYYDKASGYLTIPVKSISTMYGVGYRAGR